MDITVVDCPLADAPNPWYAGNRPPLTPAPLLKLPLGSVRPKGWLEHQLRLMVDGMTGRLTELSRFLGDDSGWLGGDGFAWEEVPYWLRGFYPLAVLTGDRRCLAESRRWIEAVLGGQAPDGYFGPPACRLVAGANRKQQACDLWPHMVMLDALIQHHEYMGDERVVPLLDHFFRFCRDLTDEHFLPVLRDDFAHPSPGWTSRRAGDMLPPIYWLYNRTGETWLLDLAQRFFEHIQPPQGEWLDHHVVNFTQRFAYPGVYAQQSHQAWHLAQTEYWYAQHLGTWGQQPRGIFGADENIRPGKVDPRQGFETCGFVEFAKSFYLLGRATGDCLYADRCEDIMLNHFPASQTPDLKGLHYLTAANQPQLDASDNHDFQNERDARRHGDSNPQLYYSPHRYRCCRHNVAMGWPWYAQNLWQATGDGGLAAWLYAACEVTARVGATGAEVRLVEQTDYPFRPSVAVCVRTRRPMRFPLYLRVPRWCRCPALRLNGASVRIDARPGSYVRIDRQWDDADRAALDMPMPLSLTTWPRNGSVTVDRGPLSYSLRIEEQWRRCGGTDDWPEYEVLPASPWNLGLVVVDADRPDASLKVVEKPVPAGQVWTPQAAPVEITAAAKPIPDWTLQDETVGELQPGPIRSDRPEQTVSLIPLGCARLRMSCLPTIGSGPGARRWPPPPAPPAPPAPAEPDKPRRRRATTAAKKRRPRKK